MEVKATIFFNPLSDAIYSNLYNKSDLEIGKQLYKYDFKIYQQNINKKIGNIHKILFLLNSLTVIYIFILLL